MKKAFTLLFLVFGIVTFAQSNLDSLYRIQQKQVVSALQSLKQLEEQNETFQKQISNQKLLMDSLQQQITVNSVNIQTVADSMGVQIQQTNDNVQDNAKQISSKTTLSFILIGIALLIAVAIAFLLHRKLKASSADEISKLKKQADDLNEKVVGKLSEEIVELQSIAKSLVEESSKSNVPTSTEPDHSLIKTLADRITFMEMTLYKMDASVRGYRQLTKSIKQMKDNLLANGYELVDMLGKEYNDGMKVIVNNFIEDEELEQGKQIITGIIKPQINYKGEMIQSAQITVSQNI